MIVFPNAKVNLGLNVIRRRPDGYHDIETVFYPIPVCDALEVVPARETTFRQTGIPVNVPAERNLVMQALAKMQAHYEIPPLSIHLMKAIPFGAGIGGGSADAAFMLRLLRDVAKLQVGNAELERYAAELGADCAFFIRNTPMFATGIGNQMRPVKVSLDGYHLCLVKPDVAVSTAEAYADTQPSEPAKSLSELILRPVEEWKDSIVNDFEKSVFPKYPEIAEIKERLYAAGAVYASMSGSGSSVYGIFKEKTDLESQFPNYFVWEGPLK